MEFNLSYGAARKPKSLILAYVLWYFAGAISAHRFYLGAWEAALVQIGMAFFGVAFALMGSPWSYLGGFLLIPWLGWLVLDIVLTWRLHSRLSAHVSTEALAALYRD